MSLNHIINSFSDSKNLTSINAYNYYLKGQPVISATGENKNIFLGDKSGESVTSGIGNTGLGDLSLINLTSGSSNTCVGIGTGQNLTTGNSNILIGSSINTQNATDSNCLVIGNDVIGNGSNTCTIENTYINETNAPFQDTEILQYDKETYEVKRNSTVRFPTNGGLLYDPTAEGFSLTNSNPEFKFAIFSDNNVLNGTWVATLESNIATLSSFELQLVNQNITVNSKCFIQIVDAFLTATPETKIPVDIAGYKFQNTQQYNFLIIYVRNLGSQLNIGTSVTVNLLVMFVAY